MQIFLVFVYISLFVYITYELFAYIFFIGKTTQVPQYLLEHAKFTQTPVKIICTEPRRIAAVSMAERVSEECGTQVSSVCLYFLKKTAKKTRENK